MPDNEQDYRALLLQFIASLTLADHMGDVSNDIDQVLKRLGLEPPLEIYDGDGLGALGTWLGKQGVTTLYGTSMLEDDDAR